jgi:hypothetical protein
MRARNLALLVLVAILAAAAWYTTEDTRPKPAGEPLTALTAETVRSIHITDGGGREVRLERRGDDWYQAHPYRAIANRVRVERLLGITQAPVRGEYPLPAGGLGEFGLEPPRLRLRLNEQVLDIGTNNPVNLRLYVRDGNRLKLIDAGFETLLNTAPETFLSPRLLPEHAEIRWIRTTDYRIERDAEGAWRIDPPRPGVTDAALQARADTWLQAQALEIQPLSSEPVGQRIEIQLVGEEQPRVFVIAEREPHRLADPGRQVVYRLPRGIPALEQLGRLP